MYYPIYFDLTGKTCLVVGGGKVAERKVKALLQFSAKVTVVSPQITASLQKLANQKKITCAKRKFKVADLKGKGLVIGATDDRQVNKKISQAAQKKNIPVNIVDDPELCTFIVPSIIKRGPLVLAISTSGNAPALAKALRQKLEKLITPQFGHLAKRLGQLRRQK